MDNNKDTKSKLRKYREDHLISKAELARKANISPITLGRIEQGCPCRLETKRKIIQALGLQVEQKNQAAIVLFSIENLHLK